MYYSLTPSLSFIILYGKLRALKMEYFYHYTTTEKWEKIRQEGLKPGRSMDDSATDPSLNNPPDLAHKPAIFGLASSAPENWLAHSYHPDGYNPHPILAQLLGYISKAGMFTEDAKNIVLLKVHLQPDDDMYACDFGEAFDPATHMPLTAAKKYHQSVTRLRDNFNAVASMKLPEILCFNPIPSDRIELVEKIPVKNFAEVKAYVLEKKRIADSLRAVSAQLRTQPGRGAAAPAS
jgi:hypothetical protein